MDKINAWKAAVTALLGALTALWGWFGWLGVGWVGLMLLDYITGSAAAAKDGQWSSKEARAGIWHKAGMVVVVIVAAGADMLLALILTNLPVIQLPIAYRGLVCPMVLVWYCITELGSIAENAVTMGAKVPAWLTKLLKAGQAAVDAAGDKVVESSDSEQEDGQDTR